MANSTQNTAPLLSLTNLKRHFDLSTSWIARALSGEGPRTLKAVDGVSIDIRAGETFSIVGESGCGKSTIAKLLVGLYKPTDGQIFLEGQEISHLETRKERANVHRKMQMIFQDPYSSLNPRWRVKDIIAEPIHAHNLISDKAAITQRVNELLSQVGLSPLDGDKFPHEFSGGQRQRISIARTLASEPSFIVCDEPTSALDVSVQAQILNLMKDLQRKLGLTYLFISHDLSVVYHISDHVGVMYLGKMVEIRTKKALFSTPKHPYTRMLLDTIPDLDMKGRERHPPKGEVPSPINPPSGCTYHPRCPYANARCKVEVPALLPVENGHVACHGIEEGRIPDYTA